MLISLPLLFRFSERVITYGTDGRPGGEIIVKPFNKKTSIEFLKFGFDEVEVEVNKEEIKKSRRAFGWSTGVARDLWSGILRR